MASMTNNGVFFTWTARKIAFVIFGFHLVLLLCINSVMAEKNFSRDDETDDNANNTDNVNNSTQSSLADCWERIRAQGPLALVEPRDRILFVTVLLLAFELLDFLAKNSGKWWKIKQIPVRGKHLDDLTTKDLVFIAISKAGTPPFVYFYLRFCYHASDRLDWNLVELSLSNTVVALVATFVVYDFFYTTLHWFLHMQAIYPWIHKHHHVQKAPSRANVDAVNVHPIEYILGEYNHLWALFLVTRVLKVHFITTIAFLAIGGFLAGLNHTRYDVVFSCLGCTIYDSKVHDVHHRIPQSNYGQYIMLWDHVFGTFRPYNPDDRVNHESQLDPTTGKSFSYPAQISKKVF